MTCICADVRERASGTTRSGLPAKGRSVKTSQVTKKTFIRETLPPSGTCESGRGRPSETRGRGRRERDKGSRRRRGPPPGTPPPRREGRRASPPGRDGVLL